MSYPQQVPPKWTKGEPVHVIGSGPRYAVGRDIAMQVGAPIDLDEICIEFDSQADCQSWLNWWSKP